MAVLATVACKKKKETPKPGTDVHPYYFKFAFNATQYNFNSNLPQYVYQYTNEFGGLQGAAALDDYPYVGLLFHWKHVDTIRDSHVMALIGRTIYFNDTGIRMQVSYEDNVSATDSWASIDTANKAYYVNIADITYIRSDTVNDVPVRIYEVTGSCSAVMMDNNMFGNYRLLSAGNFHFLCTCPDH